MKKLLFSIILIGCFTNSPLAQGRFSATLVNSNNILTFKLKPTITTNAGFSTIEFFLRYPSNSPAFTYGPVTINTSNFPGMSAVGTTGSGAWEIERNNPIYMVPGYNVDHLIYTAPAPISTVRSYTGGMEYELISVTIGGDPTKRVDLQFVHQNTEVNYYLAITGELGNDLRPLTLINYFYPLTSVISGPLNSTLYYMERLAIPLPVKLSAFSAGTKNCKVELTWKVLQEMDASYYAIERSNDYLNFKEINRIDAVLNGAYNSYSYIDKHPLQGNNYYRLKLEDKDGKFEYSSVRQVEIECNQKEQSLIYPSLTTDLVNIKLPLGHEDATIRVVNTDGKVMMVNKTYGANRVVSLKKFAAGAYMIQVLKYEKLSDNLKVILQKKDLILTY